MAIEYRYSEPDAYSPFNTTIADALYGILFAFDPSTGVTYQLGFDRSVSPFRAVWIEAGTWRLAKSRWGTWAAAKQEITTTWSDAKAIIAGGQ